MKVPEPLERRRSSRLSGEAATLEENVLPEHEPEWDQQPRKRPARPRTADVERPAPTPGSSRAMLAKLDEVHPAFLGRTVAPQDGSGAMKASVMARLRGSSVPPAHNKYSGIQEWINAIILFVNVVDGKGKSYNNSFLDSGRRMTWFASPSQTAETPAVARLLSTQTRSEAAGETGGPVEGGTPAAEPPTVMLFCRQVCPLTARQSCRN